MSKVLTDKARPPVRTGRPRRELAGDVEHRILTAARGVFIENGLGGASIDEIARRARASKPTIYGRFPTKEALFAAAVMHSAPSIAGQFAGELPTEGSLETRLAAVGLLILNRLLSTDTIEFMRLAAAEARRVPELIDAGRRVRQRAAQTAEQLLAAVAGSSDVAGFPALASERLATTTQVFLDLVVSRFLMRALLGEPLDDLRNEIGDHVSRSIGVFLAACRD